MIEAARRYFEWSKNPDQSYPGGPLQQEDDIDAILDQYCTENDPTPIEESQTFTLKYDDFDTIKLEIQVLPDTAYTTLISESSCIQLNNRTITKGELAKLRSILK